MSSAPSPRSPVMAGSSCRNTTRRCLAVCPLSPSPWDLGWVVVLASRHDVRTRVIVCVCVCVCVCAEAFCRL